GGALPVGAGGGDLGKGGGGLRGGRPPDPCRSRLVSENPPRVRRSGAALRVYELLRRARPAPQAGHVQALGSGIECRGPHGLSRERRPAPSERAAVVAVRGLG